MSATLRTARALYAAAAAGLLVLGAAGCGAVNETKKESASASPSAETSSPAPTTSASELPEPTEKPATQGGTENPTTQGGTDSKPAPPSDGGGVAPGSGTGGIGSGGLAGLGEPVEIDPTPLTDQEKEQGKQMMADLLVAITTGGDFSSLCDTTVFKEPDGSMRRMDTTPELREKCVQAMDSFSGQNQGGSGVTEEQARSMFDPATYELKDNGDGTFALTMAGQPLGFNILKIKDGGVRLAVAQ
ncbi:hypothetical protein [Dermabacter sp.]|uniref:hypothetical protein n=1 Tax=Dermabacter sp. TaxID=37640 RepID=UPI002908BCF8|nr:hypothetical protein [Dermabacter sp.]MDU4923861.1 hypothetical protein [Dermabacter sp.]